MRGLGCGRMNPARQCHYADAIDRQALSVLGRGQALERINSPGLEVVEETLSQEGAVQCRQLLAAPRKRRGRGLLSSYVRSLRDCA